MGKRMQRYHDNSQNSEWQYLGGIIQGGMFDDLRKISAETLTEMNFPFYADRRAFGWRNSQKDA